MYTEEKGHQTFIINSVRKAKAITPPAFLQLLTLVDIVAYHQDHKKINRIKEVRLNHVWQSIPFDMRKSAVITCLAEICSKCIKTAEPHPELFSFLHEALSAYDDPKSYDRDFLIRFLVSLSQYLGFGMEVPTKIVEGVFFDLHEGYIIHERPGHNYLMPIADLNAIKDIIQMGKGSRVTVPVEVRRRLVDQLVLYYQLHVESLKEVHSLKILRELQ
jgi:DNA repair protein RecO (recombination protein O)